MVCTWCEIANFGFTLAYIVKFSKRSEQDVFFFLKEAMKSKNYFKHAAYSFDSTL